MRQKTRNPLLALKKDWQLWVMILPALVYILAEPGAHAAGRLCAGAVPPSYEFRFYHGDHGMLAFPLLPVDRASSVEGGHFRDHAVLRSRSLE